MVGAGGFRRVWRDAATLILTARSPTPSPNRFDYQVLMVQRSSRSKFMPNASVFPGGVVSESDLAREWLDLLHDLGCTIEDLQEMVLKGVDRPLLMDRSSSQSVGEVVARDIAFRLTAIRETFEECGVLLTRPRGRDLVTGPQDGELLTRPSSAFTFDSVSEQERWRSQVHRDPGQLVRLCREKEVLPDLWGLVEWADWLTPTDLNEGGRRFDTLFYMASLPSIPPTLVDEQEVTKFVWSDPDSLLRQFYNKQLWLAPPQVYELSRMLQLRQLDQLRLFSVNRQGEGLTTWLPVREKCSDGQVSILPGDSGYPAEPDYVGQLDPEGKQVRRVFSGTMADSAAQCHALNRLEILSLHDTKPRVTCTPSHGHINPVLLD